MSSLKGRDQYSGTQYGVRIEHDGPYVTLEVEGSEGANLVLLTPGQARGLADGLASHAGMAEAHEVMNDVLRIL